MLRVLNEAQGIDGKIPDFVHLDSEDVGLCTRTFRDLGNAHVSNALTALNPDLLSSHGATAQGLEEVDLLR